MCQSELRVRRKAIQYRHYVATALTVALCGLLGWISKTLHLDDSNIVMILLAGVVFVSARFGHGPAVAAAVFGTLLFDFFFVPPIFSFAPTDAQYFITMGVLLGIGVLISTLTSRLQNQLRASQDQEHRTSQLYRMTRELSTLAGTERLITTAGQVLGEMFPGEIAIFSCETDNSLIVRFGDDTLFGRDSGNAVLARRALDSSHTESQRMSDAPVSSALFVPMRGAQRAIGVLGIQPRDPEFFLDPDQHQMLETCASLIALSIERDQSFVQAQQAQVEVQSEQLRNSLLSAVSHDLRTPLATIAVTATSLLEDSTEQNWSLKLERAQTVVDEARRLARQVDNLLGMARINSGTIVLNREWEALEELVGIALNRLRRELTDHRVNVDIGEDFPLLWVAGDLIELVLVNLLDNAIRYTPPGSQIEITATSNSASAEIRVADSGPGLPPQSESHVFEKFFRGRTIVADGQRGIGLGLSICRALVEAHDGQISARNRPEGGAEFIISLACPLQAPQVNVDEAPEPAGA